MTFGEQREGLAGGDGRSYTPGAMQARALLLLSLTVAISAGTHDFFGEYEKIWSNEKIFNPQASESFQLVLTPPTPYPHDAWCSQGC